MPDVASVGGAEGEAMALPPRPGAEAEVMGLPPRSGAEAEAVGLPPRPGEDRGLRPGERVSD